MEQVRGTAFSNGLPIQEHRWRLQVQEPDGVAGVFEADTVDEVLDFIRENEALYREFWIVAPNGADQ